jgi:hypothetical protein
MPYPPSSTVTTSLPLGTYLLVWFLLLVLTAVLLTAWYYFRVRPTLRRPQAEKPKPAAPTPAAVEPPAKPAEPTPITIAPPPEKAAALPPSAALAPSAGASQPAPAAAPWPAASLPEAAWSEFSTPAQPGAGLLGVRLRRWVTAIPLDLRILLLEWLAITLAVWFYGAAFLDFNTATRLPGNETEVFQASDLIFYTAITRDHQFPLWNPYVQTGQPFIADPMLHIYNPLVTLPALVFGPWNGFKIGVFLSFLVAAFGMWRLGSVLGLGPLPRTWMALMATFAGQPAARFFQGEYLFVLGFAYIPWIIVSLFLLARTRRRRHIALAVFAMAGLFFCGNAYYPFLMLFVIALFIIVMLPKWQARRPRLTLDWRLALALSWVGLLAAGLIAVQFLPLAEFWPKLVKSFEIFGAHTPWQIFLDFVSKDTYRPDAYGVLPAREEFYAYIGLTPFIALLALPLAFWKQKRRPIIFFALVVLYMVLWIDINQMPWRDLYLKTTFLATFRHLLRPLLFGGLALITLAGMSLEAVWQTLTTLGRQSTAPDGRPGLGLRWRGTVAYVGRVVLVGFMLAGVVDLFGTNQAYLRTTSVSPSAYPALNWLRQADLGDYYLRYNPNNANLYAVLATGHRFLGAWYHPLLDIRIFKALANLRPVQAQPNYWIQPAGDAPPAIDNVTFLASVGDHTVYQLPESLPLVFTASEAVLKLKGPEAGLLTRREVTPQTPYISGPNGLEVVLQGQVGETLVALVTHYPGWQVRVDDRPAELLNVSGYLAVAVQPGAHKYTFSYRPTSFYAGLALSLLALGVTLALAASDFKLSWAQVKPRLGAAWSAARRRLTRQPASLARPRRRLPRLAGEAVYAQGALRPPSPLPIAEATTVHVTVEPALGALSPLQQAWRRWWWATADLVTAWSKALALPALLFGLALVIYLLTRFIGLTRFPIYFFADEAAQTLFAERLIASGFRDSHGTWLPVYIEAAAGRWTPLLPMYLHALALTLFGKSILVTRGASVVVGVLAAVAVSLSLKQVFKVRYWWTGVLLVAITPAWFLHSRTAFETAMTTAFYGAFLWTYLLYRTRSPHYLYLALLFGAMTFYTYSNAQAVMLAAGALLFISDLRYHLKNWRTLLLGVGLAALLAYPFLAFRQNEPDAVGQHLRTVGSYWSQALPLTQKLWMYLQRYAYGLSPQYWFFPNTTDLPRHRMAGMGQMALVALPLVVVGLLVCLRYVRSAPHRAVVLAALAAPVGAAVLEIGIPRVLAFIVPANLIAALGLDWLLGRLPKRVPHGLTALVTFLVLGGLSFGLLRTALVDGPLWFKDYGLYGMQYGAHQIFEEAVPELLAQDDTTQILISSTWANGADEFLRFFLQPEQMVRVRMDGVESYLFRQLPLNQDMLFVMTASEYQKAAASPKFKSVQLQTLPAYPSGVISYPDGSPGFYFVRLAYADNVAEIFAAEKEARAQLAVQTVLIDGQMVEIHYSQTDMGTPALMFDNDLFTLMRGLEANPFIIELYFPEPRTVQGLEADFGLVDIKLTVSLYADPQGGAEVYQLTRNQVNDPHVSMSFPGAPAEVRKVRIEILNVLSGETANIHIRELHLLREAP